MDKIKFSNALMLPALFASLLQFVIYIHDGWGDGNLTNWNPKPDLDIPFSVGSMLFFCFDKLVNGT